MRSAATVSALLVFALLLGGCASFGAENNDIVGQPVHRLVAQWGQPTATLAQDDGTQVLAWSSTWGSPGNQYHCQRSLIVGPDGRVRKYHCRDCPDHNYFYGIFFGR